MNNWRDKNVREERFRFSIQQVNKHVFWKYRTNNNKIDVPHQRKLYTGHDCLPYLFEFYAKVRGIFVRFLYYIFQFKKKITVLIGESTRLIFKLNKLYFYLLNLIPNY